MWPFAAEASDFSGMAYGVVLVVFGALVLLAAAATGVRALVTKKWSWTFFGGFVAAPTAVLFIAYLGMGYVEYSRESEKGASVFEVEKALRRAREGQATPADLPILRNALRANSDVAWQAAMALGRMGRDAEPAIPDMVDAIHRGTTPPDAGWKKPLRVYSGQALAAIGPASVPALIKLLADEKAEVRLTAAESLGRIGSQESLAALAAVKNDPDENVRKAVESALKRSAKRSPRT